MKTEPSIHTTDVDIADIQMCWSCGKGMCHDGNITFYEVTVAQCVADGRNIQRIAGLEQMMGNVALARVFSPSNTVAKRLPPVTRMFCMDCGLGMQVPALMLEDVKELTDEPA